MKQNPFSRRRFGFTLIEILIVVAIAAIPIAAVGMLLAGASDSWQRIYDDSQSEARQDAYAIITSIQRFGRPSNLSAYKVYQITGTTYSIALPASGQSVAFGQAVEFRYWQNAFDPANPDMEILEVTNTGSHYALYYLDGSELKVDFGQIVDGVGGVQSGSRNTANLIETQVLSSSVNAARNRNIFNHVMSGGQGTGCVNTDLTLTDGNGVTVEVKFSTLIRSAWPR